ncbi:glycosyltransferase family 2 protein [Nanoarchaeota archaeon]
MANSEVSIIILNYNQSDYTLGCLKSLNTQSYTDFEVILVDNGSKDKSYLEEARKHKFVKVVENKTNMGFAGGNNIGVEHSNGKYIVLLNNDTIVETDWLKALVKAKKSQPEVGIFASSGTYSPKELPRYKTITLMCYNIDLDSNLYDSDLKETFFAHGCSLIYEKSLIDLPFDDDYFIYLEDTYLGWLARLKGYRVKIAKDSKLKHFGCMTTNNFVSGRTTFLGEKNRIMNFLIFYETKTLIKLTPYFLFSLVFHNIYDLKRVHSRIKSYIWLLSHFHSIIKKRHKIQKMRTVKDKDIIKYMSCKLFGESGKQIKNRLFKAVLLTLNKLAYLYCRSLYIRTVEFYDKSA